MYRADDLVWLAQSYPSLNQSNGIITGRLRYSMLYDPSDKSCTLNPSPSDSLKPGVIYHADDYSVKLEWDRRRGYPVCYVNDDKIKAIAASRSIPLIDIHMYPGGALCVATPQELDLLVEAGFSLRSFMERYLIPYLFLQTHFRKSDSVWVWEPESHGISGIVGWYYLHSADYDKNKLVELTLKHVAAYISTEMRDTLAARLKRGAYKGHMPCLCGSTTKMRNCCPRALYGINELRKALITLLVELQKRDTSLLIRRSSSSPTR
jgi:hypothetical protein